MKTYFITYGFISPKARYYSTIEAESRHKAWWSANMITNWGIANAYESKEQAMIRPGQEWTPLTPLKPEEYRKKEQEKQKYIAQAIAKKQRRAQQFKLF